MKVLFVNTIYGTGSTGKLTKSFLDFSHNQGDEVALIYANGVPDEYVESLKLKNAFSRKMTVMLERITGLTGCFSGFATKKAIDFIDSYKPDVIYLGNLHGYYIGIYKLYEAIKNRKIPCIQIMWDEFAMTGGCAFTYECSKFEKQCHACAYRREYPQSYFFDQSKRLQGWKIKSYDNDRMQFVSVPYTISKARKSMLLSSKPLFELDEAIDQNKLFYPRNTDLIRKKLGISEKQRIILDVCVYPNERKGGKYFLELARMCMDSKDLVFVHAGFNGSLDECPPNYIPIGFVNDQNELAELYSLADLFVCTSIAETQPNTCLEALSCGTPICGFNISGIPTCADKPYGHYVDFCDLNNLYKIVMESKKKTDDTIDQVMTYARKRFDSKIYNQKLYNIGCELIDYFAR